jgi:hypothetical protein
VDVKELLGLVPKWLTVLVVLVLLGVFLERVYISDKQIFFWDKRFGPASSGTGGEESNLGKTEIWFNSRNIDIPHSECLRRGEQALKATGFSNGGINNYTTVYAYDGQYVGALWCSESPRSVLITVAGPSTKAVTPRDKAGKLEQSFFEAAQP